MVVINLVFYLIGCFTVGAVASSIVARKPTLVRAAVALAVVALAYYGGGVYSTLLN